MSFLFIYTLKTQTFDLCLGYIINICPLYYPLFIRNIYPLILTIISLLNCVEPVNETEYNIELVPMPDAPATCDSDHV